MTSRNRDIANSIGLAVSNDTITNTGEISGGGSVTTYSTPANLPTSGNEAGDQAFVSSNNRLYIWNGSGWYNIALINTNPSFTSSPDGLYELATDGTPTTITLVATDPEGVPVTYTTTTDAGFDGLATVSNDSSVFTITPLSADSATTTSGNLTFKASDGVNIASAISEFTLIFAIENSRFTSLLVKASGNNGTNASTGTLIENSGNTWDAGTWESHAFSPFHPGGYSVYFDGTDDYLVVPDGDHFDFSGGSNYTIEAWIYPTTVSGSTWRVIASNGASGQYSPIYFVLLEDKLHYLASHNGSSYTLDTRSDIGSGGISTISANEWTHVAAVWDQTDYKFFVNGVLKSTIAKSGNPMDPVRDLGIGARQDGSEPFTGYITDVRVVSGTAVYTTDFTPPTKRLTAISGTQLLACASPAPLDLSTNNHYIEYNSHPKIERIGPYDYGSTNDYDGSWSASNLFEWNSDLRGSSGDMTVEGWIYNESTAADLTLITFGNETTNRHTFFWRGESGGVFYHDKYGDYNESIGSASVNDGSELGIFKWSHVAFTISGKVVTIYINGRAKGSRTLQNDVPDPVGNGNLFKFGGGGSDSGILFADMRYSNNVAKYTGTFAPPTAPIGSDDDTTIYLRAPVSSNYIYDASGSSSIQLGGDTKSSTAQTKNASSSLYFDGTGDLVDIKSSIHFGTGPFTIEAWVKRTAADTGANDLDGVFTLNSTSDWNSPGEGLVLTARRLNYGSSTSGTNFSSQFTVSSSNWYHYAVTRNNGILKAFKDGSEVFSASDTTDYRASSQSSIGIFDKYNGSSRHHWNGYIEDLRVTEGLSRYPFIPVKETLTADTNTVLLTCHDSSVTTAASGTGATTSNLSTTGDPTATTGPSYNLYAVDFDGNDNLVIPNGNTDLGAIDGAFTIEGWVNFDAAPPGTGGGAERQIVGQHSWPESGGDWWAMLAVSTGIYWYASDGGGYLLTAFPTFTWETGKWYHFALTRDASDAMGLFINGTYLAPTSNATNGKGILAQDGRAFSIGADDNASHNGVDGKISNLRISNIVRYTKTFTPPTSELYG